MMYLMIRFLFNFGLLIGASLGISFIIASFNGADEDFTVTVARGAVISVVLYLVISLRADLRIK